MLTHASLAVSVGAVGVFPKVGTMPEVFCVFNSLFLAFNPHPFELVLEIVFAFYSHVLQEEIRLNVWLGQVYDCGHSFLETFHEQIHYCAESSVKLSQWEGMGVH